MNEMVERVAKAIMANARVTDWMDMDWDSAPVEEKEGAMLAARAAIEAMRVPTEKMRAAAQITADPWIESWPVMIDAALDIEPKPDDTLLRGEHPAVLPDGAVIKGNKISAPEQAVLVSVFKHISEGGKYPVTLDWPTDHGIQQNPEGTRISGYVDFDTQGRITGKHWPTDEELLNGRGEIVGTEP